LALALEPKFFGLGLESQDLGLDVAGLVNITEVSGDKHILPQKPNQTCNLELRIFFNRTIQPSGASPFQCSWAWQLMTAACRLHQKIFSRPMTAHVSHKIWFITTASTYM
jgi:hypothetical protein